MSAQDLISKGYGGYKGWSDTEADADFKATRGTGKLTSGSGSFQFPDFDAILGGQATRRTAFNTSQAALYQDWLKRYGDAIGSQETMSSMAERFGKEMNLPMLKENAYSLNNTMNQLPNTYSSATRGFDVNANQLARVVGQKTSELAPALTTANDAANNAQTSFNTLLGYGQADQAKQLLPIQAEASFLSDRLAREATGFNQEMESELTAIIAKMNAGVTISEGEKNRANQLAIAEQTYKASKAATDAAINKGTIETINGRKVLVNTTTGEQIDLGSASTGGTGTGNISTYLPGYIGPVNNTPAATSAAAPVNQLSPNDVLSKYGFVPAKTSFSNSQMSFMPNANYQLNNTTGNNKSGLYLMK